MNSLKIPEAGLLLEAQAPAGSKASPPAQAFAITLNDNVIESMIACVRNGGDVQLALGNQPTLSYGSKSHRIAPPPDSLPYDLFLTKPFESTRTAVRIPHSGSLFSQPAVADRPNKTRPSKVSNAHGATSSQQSNSSKTSGTPDIDSDIEALQKGLAAHEAAKEKTHMVGSLPTGKKKRSALLSSYSPRSLTPTHTVKASGSPTKPVVEATQQARERAQELRTTLVHELAVKDRKTEYLSGMWKGKDAEFRPTLEKMANYDEAKKMWEMRKPCWKELDVWAYEYDTQQERDQAIKNAIKQYDKQRLSTSEPEWQRLLPLEDRNKGICLSQLQANIARGPPQPPPKIKVSKAEGGSTSHDDTDATSNEKPRKDRDAAPPRSGAGAMPPKARKFGSTAATAKKPSTPAVSVNKSKVQKPSPTKAKGGSKGGDGRVLSQEFVDNSDSSEDDAAASGKERPAAPPATSKMADTVVVKPRAAPKDNKLSSIRRTVVDEDDSSSSSGTPLAHRLPHKPVRPQAPVVKKKRPVDADREAKSTAAKPAVVNKNTSPTKSSPLASSPPTNASELDDETPPPLPPPSSMPKKRKSEYHGPDKSLKKQRVVSTEVMTKAQQFKHYYEKYETLHHQMAALDDPPRLKMQKLMDMRDRLESMKRDIYTQYNSDRESG